MMTKALTTWQPWASLIMVGAKPYEFRPWPAPQSVRGQEIVIHAGKRAVRTREVAELLNMRADRLRESLGMVSDQQMAAALTLLEKFWQRRDAGSTSLIGMGLGTVRLGEPKRCTELFADQVADIDEKMWAWPVSEIRPFAMPEPMSGAQGFWDWPGALPEYRRNEDVPT